MDLLTIHDIELWTCIGVPEVERKTEQRILVTIELSGDLSPIGTTDDVIKGIDYASLVTDVRALATTERKTIERLAEDIAEMILKKYAPASVTISIEKQPPIPGVKSVIATVTRKQHLVGPARHGG